MTESGDSFLKSEDEDKKGDYNESIESIPDPGPGEPDKEAEEAVKDHSERSSGFSAEGALNAILEGKPLNIVGYTSAGKHDFVSVLGSIGYDIRDLSLMESVYEYFGKPQSLEKSKFMDIIDTHVTSIIEDVLKELSSGDGALDRIAINANIPWLPEPFVNIVMYIESEADVSSDSPDLEYDSQDRASVRKDTAMSHITEANAFLIDDADARASIVSILIGEEE